MTEKQLQELERLHKRASEPQPECEGKNCNCNPWARRRAEYQEAACDALPELIAEIRRLRDGLAEIISTADDIESRTIQDLALPILYPEEYE